MTFSKLKITSTKNKSDINAFRTASNLPKERNRCATDPGLPPGLGLDVDDDPRASTCAHAGTAQGQQTSKSSDRTTISKYMKLLHRKFVQHLPPAQIAGFITNQLLGGMGLSEQACEQALDTDQIAPSDQHQQSFDILLRQTAVLLAAPTYCHNNSNKNPKELPLGKKRCYP